MTTFSTHKPQGLFLMALLLALAPLTQSCSREARAQQPEKPGEYASLLKRIEQLEDKLDTAQEREGHLGEVRFSLLTKDQFLKAYGQEWVLFRSIALDDSHELKKLYTKKNLPDASGRFFRTATTDGELGKVEEWTTGKPRKFKMSEDGKHHHKFPVGQHSGSGKEAGMEVPSSEPFYKKPKSAAAKPRTEGPSSLHNHTITFDEETRPKNVHVNVFVRVGCVETRERFDSSMGRCVHKIR